MSRIGFTAHRMRRSRVARFCRGRGAIRRRPLQPVTGSARLNLYVPGSRLGFAWEGGEDEGEEVEAAAPPVSTRTAPADSGQASPTNQLPQSRKYGLCWLAARAGNRGPWLCQIDRDRCPSRTRRQPHRAYPCTFPPQCSRTHGEAMAASLRGTVSGNGAGRTRIGCPRPAAGIPAQRHLSPARRQWNERGHLCRLSAVADAPARPSEGVRNPCRDRAHRRLCLAHRTGHPHPAPWC